MDLAAARLARSVSAPPEAALGVSRSLSGRRWVWRGGTDATRDRLGMGIAQRLDLPELLGRLLASRGLDPDTAADFLTPTLRALLPDPSVLADMDAASARLAEAVRAGERVAVFGDYDVDGACATALLTGSLRTLGCTVETYVPDRVAEGFGPNGPALAGLAARGAGLIVCVDCGTAAAAALAAVAGLAHVVVLDHHACDGAPPPVLATVNPNRLDCGSRLGGRCATAVVFMTLVATVRTLRRTGWFAGRPEPDLRDALDLVALATVCDVMPLTGLNRALVVQGLRVFARDARPGLVALRQVAQVNGAVSAMSLGFALGPRINAAGRLADAAMGLKLLLSDDPSEALGLAQALDQVNRQRQEVEAAMLDAALRQGEAQVSEGRAALLVAGEGWHPGVVGIVAGRLRERFNRPACVAAVTDGIARGSGRSVPGHDLGRAIAAARQHGLLTTGGGHAMAAGFGLPAAGVAALHDVLDERLDACRDLPRAADLAVDASLPLAACTVDLATQLDRLAPFGNANEEPLVALPRVRVARAERVGREGATIRAFVADEAALGRLKAVMFRARDGEAAAALLSPDQGLLHLAGHLRAETWNGSTAPVLAIVDAAAA